MVFAYHPHPSQILVPKVPGLQRLVRWRLEFAEALD